jgi:DnaJ-class molecular chaperone
MWEPNFSNEPPPPLTKQCQECGGVGGYRIDRWNWRQCHKCYGKGYLHLEGLERCIMARLREDDDAV